MAQGKDLRHCLVNDEVGQFAWHRKGKAVALDIARGLHFLHSSDVVHRHGILQMVPAFGSMDTAHALRNCCSIVMRASCGMCSCL